MQATRYSNDVIQAHRTHDGIIYASITYDFILNLHPVRAVNVLLNNEHFSDIFQTVVLANNNFMKL